MDARRETARVSGEVVVRGVKARFSGDFESSVADGHVQGDRPLCAPCVSAGEAGERHGERTNRSIAEHLRLLYRLDVAFFDEMV